MANTYTTKLNLAKPANGDVDWHTPINGNWDDIDSMLGPLYEDITSGASALTLNKSIDANSKNIDNVNILTASKIKTTSFIWIADPGLTTSRYTDNTTVGNYTSSWVTVKTVPTVKTGVTGTATINYNLYPGTNNHTVSIRLLKNDIEVSGSSTSVTSGNALVTVTVSITEGDVFKLQILSSDGTSGLNIIFGIYALIMPIIDETETWT